MDNYTGKRLDGRYEIKEVIGVGGMAVVYRAYDNVAGKDVAVKILKDEYLSNEEFRRRFKNESKAISILNHPNIVKVYNVNFGDRIQYIVMEQIDGITLKEYIQQQGRLGIKETVYFSMQILRALQHAHDKGIIHRDIKPQNIMLLSNGEIKVTDFGIARFSYSDTKTMTDSVIGSVHYISPEQARGFATDAKSDVYSVGVVMYEMLTGRLPFNSENSVSVAIMQLHNVAKSPREINPNIPVGLEQIVNKAMEKDPALRYQSAAEMLMNIEQFKQNPAITFRQNYFVDSQPTKFVPKKEISDSLRANAPQAVAKPVEEEEEPQPEEEQRETKKKVALIATGVAIGLAVIGLITVIILFMFTDVFKSDSYIVPQLVGKYYEKQVKDNSEYSKFNIVVEYKEKSGIETDMIYSQDPACNQKLSASNNTITVYVSKITGEITIPSVADETYENAKNLLESKGFTVKLQGIDDLTREYGTVIKTDPAEGTQAAAGTVITVYYASDDNLIEVPDVSGYTSEMAKELIESVNLKCSSVIETKESDRPEGEVILQSPAAGEKVVAGSTVSITVSNGELETKKTTVDITLPSRNSKDTLEVYVNNEQLSSKSVYLDGSKYEVEVEGREAASKVKICIGGSEYYSCTVDFSSEPIRITDGQYSAGGISAVSNKKLPSVTGRQLTSAQAVLENEGFRNISVKYQTVTEVSQDGMVLAQSPSPSSDGIFATTYSTDTLIELTVGQMEGIN